MILRPSLKSLKSLNILLASRQFSVSISKKKWVVQDLANYRSLIRIQGADSAKFLQNMITNDIHLLDKQDNKDSDNPQQSCLYAMILNNRGRVLYDTIVYPDPDTSIYPTDSYLIELDTGYLEQAMKMFKMFKIKKQVHIECMDHKLQLCAAFDDNESSSEDSGTFESEAGEGAPTTFQDPRWPHLKSYRLISDQKHETQTSSIATYKQFLYTNGIAENNSDFAPGSSIPLEYNLVFMNGVSFQKGCYLGQELVAKTHHTGVIRKRIMPLELLDLVDDSTTISFPEDAQILNTQSGKTVGKLRGMIGNKGIGMVRLSKIDNEQMVVLDANEKGHKCRVHVPVYWETDEAFTHEMKDAKL